jgi:hypothetical protein
MRTGLLLKAVYHVRMKTLLLGLLLGIVRVTYLPVAPGTAVRRWGALSSLVGGLLGAATFLPFLTPYLTRGNVEATDTLTGQVSSGSPQLALATVLCILGIVGLYATLVAHSGRPDPLAVSGASLAALSAVSLLALLAYITAGSLGWLHPPGEDMFRWEQRRTTLLQEVGMGAYALGLLLVGTSTFRARLFGRLRALPLVVASLWPANIGLLLLWDRSGLVVLRTELIIGALPFLGAALLGLVMLTYYRPGSGSIGPGGAD